MADKNLNAILPDGTMFHFWEKDCRWEKTLYVACCVCAGRARRS